MDSRVSRAHGCAGATQLKTPYSDGTTHVILEPLDFMSHILVLHPSGQLKLFKIVPDDFVAPNSKHRVDLTPTKRGKGRARKKNEDKTPEQRHRAMSLKHSA
jgi:hypothetical protein